jgi:hypothetical protein
VCMDGRAAVGGNRMHPAPPCALRPSTPPDSPAFLEGNQSFIHAATRFPAKRLAKRRPVVPMGKYEIMYHSSATSWAMAAMRVRTVECNCALKLVGSEIEPRGVRQALAVDDARMRRKTWTGIAAGSAQGCGRRRITHPDGKVQGQSYRPKVAGRKGQALGRNKVLHCPKHVSQALRMRRASPWPDREPRKVASARLGFAVGRLEHVPNRFDGWHLR